MESETAKKGKIYVYGRRDKHLPNDLIKINVTSHSKEEWSKQLSPFYLGPVEVYPFEDEMYTSNFFENAWQFLKVYKGFEDKEEYLKWAVNGFNSKKAIRFPFGKPKKCLHSTWNGEKLQYIEARHTIYAPLYANAVRTYAKDSFEKLISLYNSGKDIALFDFDGYDYHKNKMTLKQVLYNSKKKMGHAFILAMMIEGQEIWNENFDESLIQ
jgi:hypothetical protein